MRRQCMHAQGCRCHVYLSHDAAGVSLLGNEAGQCVHHQAGALWGLLCVQHVGVAIDLESKWTTTRRGRRFEVQELALM